ncbi:MAG: ABC transporter ATP-binding protein [Eubacterium sp.]|nr:ABC transporter ATP-binding protein [Eubacterium sp.]
MDVASVIDVDQVTVSFRMADDKIGTLKEYVIRLATKKIVYHKFNALCGITFCVNKGDVLGIIGHNGAGKSTLLKVISGIMKPAAGVVTTRGNIVPMLELGSGFDFEMTGRENIFLNGAILGYTEDFLLKKYEEIVAFSGLERFIHVPLRNYSSGMVMRLAFSIAATVQPEILIVDEILAVGDADFQEKSRERMRQMMSGGTTVLFVTHDLEQVRQMCNKVLWIEHGEMVEFGKTQEICDKYERKEMP